MFTKGPKAPEPSIEDTAGARKPLGFRNVSVANSAKRKAEKEKPGLTKTWREALGPPPKRNDGLKEWIKFQKKKWQLQARQRREEEGFGRGAG